jgi:CRP/FNR family transcriptional regulator
MTTSMADARPARVAKERFAASEWSASCPPVRHATSARFRADCAKCRVRHMCLPSGMPPADVPLLDFVVVSRRTVQRGQTLYRTGDRCDTLYALRAGFFKTVVISANGVEQVTGLRMAGDVLGLDGVATGRHGCDAVALDTAEVCVAPFPNLLRQALHADALQRAVVCALGREIDREQALLLLLGGMWGVQRVAAFLLDVSERMQAHGYSPAEFELRLTRREVGSYLGIELETVSRIVSRLERDGLIAADRGHIRIVDRDGLARVAADRGQSGPFAAKVAQRSS